MATSNNDRISSRRLLDTLKGLQASRHLGSEPEVVTTTVPETYVPIPGTYDAENMLDAFPEIDERGLPFKVYTDTPVSLGSDTLVFTEPTGNYIQVTKAVEIQGIKIYTEDSFETFDEYSGFIIGTIQSGTFGYQVNNGRLDINNPYPWSMSEFTFTEVTKHAIKQAYVPNADWNVNDPDADGYVEGRTHWVETQLGDLIPETVGAFNYAPSFDKIYGYSWDTGPAGEAGEWYPEFEAVNTTYDGIGIWLLAMDNNGNQITNFETAMSSSANMIAVMDSNGSTGKAGYIMSTRPPKTIRMVGEIAHKLDKKYYEYTEPFDPTGYTKDSDISIQTITRNYESSQGPFTHSYDFVKLPNGRAYGNVTLHVDSWDDTTKTGTFSTVGTPLANPGSMIGGTAYVNGGIVFFSVEADGSNPRISNPIPSDLHVVNRAGMWIPQMFIRKEDE